MSKRGTVSIIIVKDALEQLFWVLPFGRPFYNATEYQQLFEKSAPADKVMVYGNDMLNKAGELHKRKLYRIAVKLLRSDRLLKYLKQLRPFEEKT